MRQWLSNTGIPQSAILFKVLKCIHQEMISVPVLELRRCLYDKYPYKDTAKSWKVEIEIDSKNGITIRHRKREQSHSSSPDDYFSFEWKFEIVFNKSMTNFDVCFHISDWWISEEMDPQKKEEMELAFRPFIREISLYRRIIEKDDVKDMIYEQFLKMAPKFHLKDANKAPLAFTYPKIEMNMWEILVILSKTIGYQEDIDACNAFMKKVASSHSNYKQRVNEIFVKGLGHHKAVKLLKALHPEIRELGFLKIHDILGEYCPGLEDNIEEWTVKCQLSPASIILTLESIATDKETLFQLHWEIVLKFNQDLSQFTVDVKITDWNFGKLDQEKQNSVRKAMDFLVKQSVYYTKQLQKEFDDYKVFNKIVQAAQRTTVVVDDQIVYKDTQNQEGAYYLLTCLAKTLDSNYFLGLIRSRSLKLTCDDVGERNDNIKDLLKKKSFDISATLKVLRCLDTYILTPSILKLRYSMYDFLPYVTKTAHTSDVDISRKRVTITSERTERALSHEPVDSFEFTWRLALTFTKDMSKILKTDLYIIDWSFSQQTSKEVRAKFDEIAAPFIPEWAPYRRIWKSSVALLGQDLLTCASMVRVDVGGSIIYSPDKKKEKLGQIRDLLGVIIEKVDPIKANKLQNLLNKSLESKTDLVSGLDNFLSNESLIQSDSYRVLKLMSQQVLNPAIMKLRKEYFNYYPYKFVKGSWRVLVSFSKDGVIVKHSKEEKSTDVEKLESYFSFKWQLSLKVNIQRDRLRSNLQIKELKFHEKTSQQVRAGVQSLFGAIVRDTKSAFTNSIELMSASELLGHIITTLEKSTNVPTIEHPLLCKYDLPSLLRNLDKSMSGIQIPPVTLPTPRQRRSVEYKDFDYKSLSQTYRNQRSGSLNALPSPTSPMKSDFSNDSSMTLQSPSGSGHFRGERTVRKTIVPGGIKPILEEETDD